MQRVNVEQHIPWVWLIVSGPFSSLPTAASTEEEVTISASGVIAYYHSHETGLQQIAIQRSDDEDSRPLQHH